MTKESYFGLCVLSRLISSCLAFSSLILNPCHTMQFFSQHATQILLLKDEKLANMRIRCNLLVFSLHIKHSSLISIIIGLQVARRFHRAFSYLPHRWKIKTKCHHGWGKCCERTVRHKHKLGKLQI